MFIVTSMVAFHHSDLARGKLEASSRRLELIANLSDSKFHYSDFLVSNSTQAPANINTLPTTSRLELLADLSETRSLQRLRDFR
jgi:hypothetical protein